MYKFSSLVNTDILQSLAEKLYSISKIPIGIVDTDGIFHVKAGWQQVCLNFHRVNPETLKRCQISDNYINQHLYDGRYIEYKCLNNLWDVAMPVFVAGSHIATLFVGQFFYDDEEIDCDFFIHQAEEFGFDKEAYLDAVMQIPRIPRKKIEEIMDYYATYVRLLAETGFKQLEFEILNQRLSESEEFFRVIYETAPIGVCVSSIEGSIFKANQALCEITGYSKEELYKKNIKELTYPEDWDNSLRQIEKLKKGQSESIKLEVRYVNKEKETVWVNSCISMIKTLGHTQYLTITVENISHRKESEEEISFLSYHDPLTGIYNRRAFQEALERLDVSDSYPLSVIMADVNGLKLVNDSFGHNTGDELLKKVAAIMESSCRKQDIIARIGGDEFLIILPCTDAVQADQIITRIFNQSQQEMLGVISISVSMGRATKMTENEDIQNILKKAENIMYSKKLFESQSMRNKTIDAIIAALHEKNKREEQHSHRVGDLAVSLGKAIGLTADCLAELKMLGLLHDIGKIAIDEKILNKAGALTKYEFDEIKRHPEVGYRILSSVEELTEIAEYILYHHERWDGSGYPKGLKSEEIPLQSRIIAIADAYDAMTSERPYRSALEDQHVLDELIINSSQQFDPQLVPVFIQHVIETK